jgi:zinc/manganese transport system substrate-binding protein
MTSPLRRLALGLLASAALLAVPAAAADKLPVTASFSILGDLTAVVGGDRVAVHTLVGPDEDAHVFEPRPADARRILQSRLLVLNGLGFEPWAQKLAKSAGYRGETVVVSKGVKARALNGEKGHGHDHDHADPHAWQNPDNVAQYVRNIAAALSKIDPAGADTYGANRDAYIRELQALDTWIRSQLATIPAAQRKVITSHDAFGYFAAHYQVRFLAAQGVSTESAPSAREVGELIRQIKREKIRTVFVESMSDPKLVAQLAKDAGASVGGSLYSDALSPAGKPAPSYLLMMRHNVTQLVQGMKQN